MKNIRAVRGSLQPSLPLWLFAWVVFFVIPPVHVLEQVGMGTFWAIVVTLVYEGSMSVISMSIADEVLGISFPFKEKIRILEEKNARLRQELQRLGGESDD